MYNAIVAKVASIFPIDGADFIVRAIVAGQSVIVGIDTKVGDLGIFFPTDGQLSQEFADQHNLIGYTDENGVKQGGYFAANRRIRAQKFRGVKSEGFFMPISCVDYTGANSSQLVEGFEFSDLNGKPICNKYFTPATLRAMDNNKKVLVRPVVYDLPEHFDTANFRFCTRLPDACLVHITEKLHGTSVRFGHVPVTRTRKTWLSWLSGKFNKRVTEYEYVLGTRRAILSKAYRQGETTALYSGGYYGSGEPYALAAQELTGKLHKDEIFYGELVGYVSSGAALFRHDTKELKDIRKKYGDSFDYSYGNLKGEHSFYVYRITQNGRDLSRFEIENRCAELGVKVAPLIHRVYFPKGDGEFHLSYLKEIVGQYEDGCSTLDTRHIREGVCILIESADGTKTWKAKSFSFAVLEGYAKSDETAVDVEEAA